MQKTMDYKTYLATEHWQQTRKKRLEIDGFVCAVCGRKDDLNVHHLNYSNIGSENIENDLLTLCHSCHAMLHRIRLQSDKEYNDFINCEQKYKDARIKALWKKISDLITVEIWLRDKANGGDIDIWNAGGGMVGKLKKIAKMIYSDVNFSHGMFYAESDIKDSLRIAKAMKICEMYRQHNNIGTVAEKMNMKPTNVQKVLKRHGFNATGKIK